MIFAPKHSFKDRVMEKLPPPLIESTGGANRFNSSLNRLVRTKHLIPRSVALREWEYTKTIRARLLSRISSDRFEFEERIRKEALRKEFGSALCANTAFAHLLERKASWKDVELLMGSTDHITLTTGATAFTKYDAEWLSTGAKYEDFSIEDLTICEDLHSREDVSEEQTFKVGGLILRPIVGKKIRRVETKTRVGLYQINAGMEEWAGNLFQRLLNHREEGKPLNRDDILTEVMTDPEWVNDDTGLIDLCLRATGALHQRSARVGLVSADRRLANQMSNTCNVQVERLSPVLYIVEMRALGLDPVRDRDQALRIFAGRIPARDRNDPVREIFVDTGSVSHFLTNMEEPESGDQRRTMRRDHVYSEIVNGTRSTTYTLREIPRTSGAIRTEPFRPVLRDRAFPHRQWSGRPRGARMTSHPSTGTQSWRSGSNTG